MKENLGQFQPLVASAGSLMAAAAALLLTFRRRAKWEPAEQDLPKGGERLSGLLVAVSIAVLWMERDNIVPSQFALMAGVLAIIAVVMLLVYGVFIATLTKDRRIAVAYNQTATVKIIGGFWLTPVAKASVSAGQTVQQVLAGVGNDPDSVWPPLARALAKMCFVLCYILLIASGTVALTCASLLVGKAAVAQPQQTSTAAETLR